MKRLFGWVARIIALPAILLCLVITVVPPFLDRIYYEGPRSTHFDGARFFNPDGEDTFRLPIRGGRGPFFLRWLTGQDGREIWPARIPITPTKPAAHSQEMRATWIGHATVLIQVDGLNILTDPIWAERAGPFGFGPARVTEPGIRFDDLPKIDLVLVSHNHYDHMDLATIKRLWERDRPLIVTSLGNDALIGSTGPQVTALDWGQRKSLRPGVDVIVTRNHHWSSRWFADQRRALWSSFVVTLPDGNLFFAGDTGFGDGKWTREARSYGPIRLAIIPIGAFRFVPGGMEIGSHIGPIKAERVFAGLGATFAIPVHWGTFQLSNEGRDTPPRMLAEVIKCAGYAEPSIFAAHSPGESIAVPALKPVTARPAPPASCLTAAPITSLR